MSEPSVPSSGLTPTEVIDTLAKEGWRGFSLLRRYLTEHPGDSRVFARQLRSVPWDRRGDVPARRVRFAFLADCSTLNLQDSLVLECLARGIVPEQYHAPVGHIAREVRDPESGLWAHPPDIVVVSASPSRISEADLLAGGSIASEEAFLDSLVETLRLLRGRCNAALLVHNFIAPEFRPLGLDDWREPRGLAPLYSRLNLALYERCRDIPGTRVLDLDRLIALAGARWWTLHKTFFLATLGLPEEVTPLLCRDYAAVAAAIRGFARKCLVTDLDDTLWGGVVGEVGTGGLQIGGAHPGTIYRQIQEVIRQLHEGGVILAINSHNNEEDAWQPFHQRTEMILRKEDFAAWRINWQDKASNLRELSEQLGVGVDTLVVLDDDPVERDWIEKRLPEVHVLPAQDPLEMLHTLATCRLFEGLGRTAEDTLRGSSYGAAPLRRKEQALAADREAFLAELNLLVTVGRPALDQLPRLVQLTQRTNQFNLTTRRYTQPLLAELHAAADCELLYCSCRDRFADEGVTGLVILRKPGPEWLVDSFLLSCRVLGWGVERALAAAVCRFATEKGAAALKGEYIATQKNRQTERFYRDVGFSPLTATEGNSTWRLALPCPQDLNPRWISLQMTRDTA